MKKIVVFVVLSFVLSGFNVYAQNIVSNNAQKGFWVIVTNRHIKKEATIQFYNDEKQLIYEEKIFGKRLKLNKAKTIHCLEEGLAKALTAYNNDKTILKNKDWMSVLLASR